MAVVVYCKACFAVFDEYLKVFLFKLKIMDIVQADANHIKKVLINAVDAIIKAGSADTLNGVDTNILAKTARQLTDILIEIDDNQGEELFSDEEITTLGDRSINLFNELVYLAERLKLDTARENLDEGIIMMAMWLANHNASIRMLEPVVDALAKYANSTKDPAILKLFSGYVRDVINAVDPNTKPAIGKTDMTSPWRILNLNYGIVATRSHDAEIMDSAFSTLVKNVPEAAFDFFSQGMEQMDALDYPQHVREVMGKYHNEWNTRTLH